MISLDKTNIEEMLPEIPVKEVLTSKRLTTGKTIYGYNPDKKRYNTWNSLEECTYFLTPSGSPRPPLGAAGLEINLKIKLL